MEPQLFSRGNFQIAGRTSFISMRFNGAAAFQPRKWHSAITRRVSGCPSFNGAAAFQPRKLKIKSAGQREAKVASMEPQLFSRGNLV